MERILVVTVNWLGDAVLTTPVFKALKDEFPSSYIGVMTPSRVKDVFEDNPSIDEVIIFDEKITHKTLRDKLSFISQLKAKKFDTALLIHRSATRTLICLLAGIKTRIGYRRLKTACVLTKRIKPPSHLRHRQDQYLYLLEKIGIPINDRNPSVFLDDRERKHSLDTVKPYLEASRYLIAINPSANWRLKRWPPQYFSQLADMLKGKLSCTIFLIGADKDRSVAESVQREMKQEAVNLCGKTSLKELKGILERMDLLLSADSGPTHLASALGIPSVVLFGPTSHEVTGPRGGKVKIVRKDIDCTTPCYQLDCPDNVCMKGILPGEVFEEIKGILQAQ